MVYIMIEKMHELSGLGNCRFYDKEGVVALSFYVGSLIRERFGKP
jgi:hypothetical protein